MGWPEVGGAAAIGRGVSCGVAVLGDGMGSTLLGESADLGAAAAGGVGEADEGALKTPCAAAAVGCGCACISGSAETNLGVWAGA